MLTYVISEWSYAISRARVGEYVSNYEPATPQLHDHTSFMKFMKLEKIG